MNAAKDINVWLMYGSKKAAHFDFVYRSTVILIIHLIQTVFLSLSHKNEGKHYYFNQIVNQAPSQQWKVLSLPFKNGSL